MSIEFKDVAHVAKLARLALSDDELNLYREQLSRILDHAGRVTALETEDVAPTSHPVALANVFREDEVIAPLTQAEVLANAPLEEAGHFRVPRILEPEG